MAIGFDQAGGTAGVGGVTSLSVDITAAATGSVVYCHVQVASNVGALTFTNWTLIAESDEGTASHGGLWRRTKVGGDTTFTVSWTGSNNATASWASYTGVDTTTPDEQAAQSNHTASSASYVTATATPTTATRWALSTYGYRSTTAARTWSNATATQRVDTENLASRWSGTSIADSNGTVAQSAQSFTGTLSAAEAHGTTFILFLIASAATSSPFKNSALTMIQVTQGGRGARRRVGFWHTIAHQNYGSYLQTVAEIMQHNVAQTMVLGGRPGRAMRRRSGIWHRVAHASQTVYQDNVISAAQDRSNRLRVPVFRNNDRSPIGLLLRLGTPIKNAAAAIVALGAGGRRGLRRVGFWHNTASNTNTAMSAAAEVLQSQPAQTMISSGPRGRGQRRRAGQWQATASNTNTVYQDTVISSAEDRSNRTRVPRFPNNDRSASPFLAVLALVAAPFKNAAAFMVLIGRGGRRALRRVGYWHTVTDQVNTAMSSTGELPQVNISPSPVMGGRKPMRRRAGATHSASTETHTVYQDRTISAAEDRSYRARVPKQRNNENPNPSLFVTTLWALVAPIEYVLGTLVSRTSALTLVARTSLASVISRIGTVVLSARTAIVTLLGRKGSSDI